MGKVRKGLSARSPQPVPHVTTDPAGPGRIHGASITPRNEPPDIGAPPFLIDDTSRVTVGGSDATGEPTDRQDHSRPSTVRLSDGTQVTFSPPSQLEMPSGGRS
jgi:hypothetical protein